MRATYRAQCVRTASKNDEYDKHKKLKDRVLLPKAMKFFVQDYKNENILSDEDCKRPIKTMSLELQQRRAHLETID